MDNAPAIADSGVGDSGVEEVERAAASGGGTAALDYLIDRFRAAKEYGRMFETRLMKKRLELGAPLMPLGPVQLEGAPLKEYDQAMVEAAREAARLYLDEGRIQLAWPYFRALGDTRPIRDAIDAVEAAPGGNEGGDGLIEIALGERVHPKKGFEMLLAQHGICRAITLFDQYPDAATREDALHLLARTLHGELISNLRGVIERNEGTAPDAGTVEELIAGREWLFGEFCYHVDVSHLMSVVRMTADSENPETLRLGLAMAEYGQHLSAELNYKGEPPFEDVYRDYGMYLRALLGRDVDEAVAHFRNKVASYDYNLIGTYPAQVLVKMLLRLGRPQQAIAVFEEFVGESDPNYLTCPGLAQLCQIAGDYEKLMRLAAGEGDLIRYAAAMIDQRRSPNQPEHQRAIK